MFLSETKIKKMHSHTYLFCTPKAIATETMAVKINVLYVFTHDLPVVADCNFIKCYFLKSAFNHMTVKVLCPD